MTARVIALRPDMSVRAAAEVLESHGFTAAPVEEPSGRLVGMVTEADLLRGRIVRDGGVRPDGPDSVVATVMNPAPRGVGRDDDVADVVVKMLQTGVRSVPVMDGTKLVGILTRRDVLRAVARRELASAEDWRRRSSLTHPDDHVRQ
jgi:CBS domain-containing protein